jgi:pre-rRNA-processing protein TSR2
MSLLSTILPIIRSIFSRWTALQLAVTHSMGGSESEAKYEAFIQAFGEYLTRNIRPSLPISTIESDIQQYLDEILDEEFNTVLDDGSSFELAQLFVRYIHLILQGKLNEVQQELQIQQSSISPNQMSIRNENDESSSSSSESENDMIEEEKSKTQSMDIDEDGWTTVRRRNGGKK